VNALKRETDEADINGNGSLSLLCASKGTYRFVLEGVVSSLTPGVRFQEMGKHGAMAEMRRKAVAKNPDEPMAGFNNRIERSERPLRMAPALQGQNAIC